MMLYDIFCPSAPPPAGQEKSQLLGVLTPSPRNPVLLLHSSYDLSFPKHSAVLVRLSHRLIQNVYRVQVLRQIAIDWWIRVGEEGVSHHTGVTLHGRGCKSVEGDDIAQHLHRLRRRITHHHVSYSYTTKFDECL